MKKQFEKIEEKIIDLYEFCDLFEEEGFEEYSRKLRVAINKILKKKEFEKSTEDLINLYEFSDLFEINGYPEHADELRLSIDKILRKVSKLKEKK